MSHGGRDHSTLPNWTLSVAQAVTATPKDFDHYEMPKDDKVEAKPRHPTHFATWLKQARNEIKMLGSVLGLEHKAGRLRALEQIEQAHEADPEAWPETYCYSLWEELKAAWIEELREGRRRLRKLLNCEQPRKEDLRFVALAPGSGFTFPTTFELDDPQGYYQKVCVPRQQRAIKSIIFGQLHHRRQAPVKVGENPGEEKAGEEQGENRIGRVKGGKGSGKGDKGENPKNATKAYPAGKRLRPKEAADSIRHGPKTKEGKPICWDSACHSGCQREACSHAHVPIQGTRGLHWTVVAQLIRRGGLKSGPAIQPGQVDGRIAQLRSQAKQEQGDKVAEGSKQGGGGDKQGWLPPEEYELQYTALEDDLRELTRGPDYSWLEDAGPGPHETKEWNQPVTHPEAIKRQEKLEELEDAGMFQDLKNASEYLQSHIRGRVLNDALEGKETGVEEVLLEASSQGCKELAEEAMQELQRRGRVGREDSPHSAWVGPPTWDDQAGYGTGRFQFLCGGHSYDWEYVDYKDTVPAGEQIASAIGMRPGDLEERQCLLLHPAAGVLSWENGRRPGLPEVQELAQRMREELWDHAAAAAGELGDPAPWIGAREHEVRGFIHDCLHSHHDKDYRLFHAFPIKKLQHYTMQFWRVNYLGQYQVDHIVGKDPGSEERIIPFLIHGGHIRLLNPGDKDAGLRLAREITLAGKADREWVTVGWREVLEGEDPAAPLVPSKRPKCARCQDQQSDKVGRRVTQIPWSFEEHDPSTQEQILARGHQPLRDKPAFAYGIVAQEVFAGSGGWSRAMKEAGHRTLEPIEVFEDPMLQKGYRPDHDIKDPKVRSRLLAQARELPGPDSPNLYHFGTVCTSFCDFNLLNGGTRTFERPEGDPNRLTQSEEDGNLSCEFTRDLCLEAYLHDKEFVIENTMPTGRYPKLWDQPAMKRLQVTTGALFIPAHLCEWGLAPADQPTKRYRKGQWNLVSPGVYAYALLLARPCQRQHEHVPVKGGSAAGNYPRAREAQVYPPALCRAWAIVHTAALKGWGSRPILARLTKLADQQQLQQWGGQGGNEPDDRAYTQAIEAITQRRKQEGAQNPNPDQGRSRDAVVGSHEEGDAEEAAPAPGPGPEEDGGEEAHPSPGEVDQGENPAEVVEDEEGGDDDEGCEEEEEASNVEGSDPADGDEWSFCERRGRLWRWHRWPRTEQFGHRPEDWHGSPIDPSSLSNYRKTMLFHDGRWFGSVEDCRYHNDPLDVCAEPWTGYTEFHTLEARAREEAEGREESGDDDQDAEVEAEEEPEEDASADEDGESEMEEQDSTTSAPPSDAPSLRSRTHPHDEDRRVGYLAHSRALEEMCVHVGREDQELREAAKGYIDWCVGQGKYSPAAVKEAALRGDRVLMLAGDLSEAMQALRQARQEAVGEPLRGVLTKETQECISEDHYAYLEEMIEHGIPSRREYPRKRVRAEPYPSALDYLDEIYEKSWKDAKWGIVLYCTDATEDQTKDLIECPQGRVPKQLPDRSISSEGRPIHAMLVANAATHKYHHPPALQPRHRQIARKALWWSYRHPGISCTLAKLDVSRAFKWHDVRPEDAADFGSALPGRPVGVEGRVKLIYGGMPFGWTGAPGEYMIFALAGRAIHESYRPSQASVNGPTAFSSEWLMDDSVSLEPKLGTRPWEAVDCLGYAITKVWGADSLNLEKQVEEGTPGTKQIVWGMIMDMDEMTCRLPEPKALKMRYLLALDELRYGCREVRLRTARELRGLAQYASIALPPLRTELSVLDVMLSANKADGGLIRPNVEGEAAEEAAWTAWDETVELLRVWFEVPCESHFEATFDEMLTPRELLAIPGRGERLRWVGGDATLEVIGTLDWKSKAFMREPAGVMLEVLSGAPELCGEEVEVRIALAELVCYVGYAAAVCHEWGGEIVAYATDNMNVRVWLATRRARTPMARHLLRILGMLESRYRFRTLAFYIRTYHNVTADWISRESKEVVERELLRQGWHKVEPAEEWPNYLQDALRGVYRWSGETGDVAMQIRGARGRTEVPRYRPIEAKGNLVEIGCGFAPWATAWTRLGGQSLILPGGDGSWGQDYTREVGLRTWDEQEEITWLACSLTEDTWSYGRRRWRKALEVCAPVGVIVDMPDKGPKESVVGTLREKGFGVCVHRVRCTDFGDAVAKVKWIVIGLRGWSQQPMREGPKPTAVEVNGIDKVVRRGAGGTARRRFEGDVALSSRISTTGDRMLPWPAGHAKGLEGGRKQLVYDIRGPALTPRKEEEMLVVDYLNKENPVRYLTIEEEWLTNGGTRTQIHQARTRGMSDQDLKGETLRCMPQRTAHHLMGWAERTRTEGEESKVGVCRDKDRRKMDDVVRTWLRAWRGNPEAPRRNFEESLREGDEKKVGGGAKRRRPSSAPPGGDVRPVALGRSRERLVLDANLKLSKDRAWLDALAAEAVMSKLSEGSRASYEVGWRQWCTWRRVQQKDIYLKGETRDQRKEDEDDMLRFLTFLAVMRRAEGTVRQRLFALKMGHVVAGYEDPTLHRTRLWAALTGFKRWQPETRRKYPVLPCMMRWIKQHLAESASFSNGDKIALWAAMATAFFFLLRASEYLVQANRSWSTRRVLKGCEVEGRTNNQTCRIQNAQEVVIYLTGSKTDQYNQGTIRNHYRSGDLCLCPVRAFGEMERHYPERFRGAEAEEPLFRFEDGTPITRDDIHGMVQLAAVADGQQGARFGSHSLRIGGATALYQGTKDLEQVKRFGRWTSDAFHGYLWESHERQEGLAARMAKADGQLLAPRRDDLGVKVGQLRSPGEGGANPPCSIQTKAPHTNSEGTLPEEAPGLNPLTLRGISGTSTGGRTRNHGTLPARRCQDNPGHRVDPTRKRHQRFDGHSSSSNNHGGKGDGGGTGEKGVTTDEPILPSKMVFS